jgi:ribosomal protein S13
MRHRLNLPVRGQRTHTNGKTQKTLSHLRQTRLKG